MPWLRTRRRTLDIVCEDREHDNSYTKKQANMNTGTYNLQNRINDVSNDIQNHSLLDNNGNLSDNMRVCGRNDMRDNNIKFGELKTEVRIINVKEYDDINFGSIKFEEKYNCEENDNHEGVKPVVSDNNMLSLDLNKFQHSSSTSELDDIRNMEDDEMKAILKSCLSKPRRSLDSQMNILSQYSKLQMAAMTYGRESLPELEEIDEFDTGNNKQDRKSISWAEDLETIHEFEKIKARRMSLSALFKKF